MIQKQAGFTIPELIVTIVFIGFAFVGITQLYLSIQRIQEQTSWLQSASHAAQTEVESLRNNNYSELVAGQNIDFSTQLPSNLPTPRSGSVAVSEPQAGLKRIDVTVSYSDHGTPRHVEMTSLIGIIGISQ
jgi:type II secretory pathway pseudopilin PulG